MGCKQSKDTKKPPVVKAKPVAVTPAAAVDTKHTAAAAPSDVVDTKRPMTPVQSPKNTPCGTRFSNGAPAIEGTYKALFTEGLLYQITYNDGNSWAFYNDTNAWEMRVTYVFGPRSNITVGGKTEKSTQDDGWLKCTLKLNPGETSAFMTGKPNGYKSSFQSCPLSEEYKSAVKSAADGKLNAELAAVRALDTTDLEELAAKCVATKTMFVDVSFPPLPSSLYRDYEDPVEDVTSWKRPQDCVGKTDKIALIVGKIEPNDIDQGALGDCWLLCSIAAVAEFPAEVKTMLNSVSAAQQKKEQAVGCYRILLNKHGWYHDVIVDSYMPVSGNGPCFAKNKEERGELWVSLVEKAYAKVNGSYSAIVGGDALEGMQDLTGAPSLRLEKEWLEAAKAPFSDGANALFKRLVEYDQLKYLLTASTPGQDDSAYMGGAGGGDNNTQDFSDKYKKAGLGMGHAYTVLEVQYFEKENFRLIKIRNPWGNGVEWSGAWNDKDEAWVRFPHIKERCRLTSSADGTFWMSYSDALQWFDGIGVCFLLRDAYDYRIQGKFNRGCPSTVLQITVKEPITVYFMLSQRDTRGVKEGTEEAKSESHILHLCSPTETGLVAVTANSTRSLEAPSTKWTFNNSRDLCMRVDLKPNDKPYYLIPNPYNKKTDRSYVLGMMCSKPLEGVAASVAMMQPEPTLELFKNYPQFQFAGKPTTATYQIHTDEPGALKVRQGSSIEKA